MMTMMVFTFLGVDQYTTDDHNDRHQKSKTIIRFSELAFK
jgi:hypothetical protein